MNPLEEARARLDRRYEVRVLEPAPPAIAHEPFTDDPTARGNVPDGRVLVAPFATGVAGDITWNDLARDDAELAAWCAERALGAWPAPPAIGDGDALIRTRLALHSVAEHVLCPARHRVNGKIGLRFTRGGFGTPFFGTDEQVRVEGSTLVYTAFTPARETRTPLSTVAAAAAAVGIEPGAPNLFTPTTQLEPDRALDLDGAALAVLGWWYGFAAAVLAQLRADPASSPEGADPPTLVQLWPEHFDMSTDLGDAATGRRANYGASPGDAANPEPYLYVGPWEPARVVPAAPGEGSDGADGGAAGPVADPFWNQSFGASLPYSALLESTDAYATALAFFRAGRDRLAR